MARTVRVAHDIARAEVMRTAVGACAGHISNATRMANWRVNDTRAMGLGTNNNAAYTNMTCTRNNYEARTLVNANIATMPPEARAELTNAM